MRGVGRESAGRVARTELGGVSTRGAGELHADEAQGRSDDREQQRCVAGHAQAARLQAPLELRFHEAA